jgi:AcrR family transcriptional regulator
MHLKMDDVHVQRRHRTSYNALSSQPLRCTLYPMPYPSKTDRQAILTTAMEQTAREGIENLAIRSVATALHLAPNALYRYFANLSALKAALAEESRILLLKVLQKAAGAKPPEEAIRSIARAYMRFAREKPHVFALTLLPFTTEAKANGVHRESWRFMLGQVARVYGVNPLIRSKTDRPVAARLEATDQMISWL